MSEGKAPVPEDELTDALRKIVQLQGNAIRAVEIISGVIAGMEKDSLLRRSQWPSALRVALELLTRDEGDAQSA